MTELKLLNIFTEEDIEFNKKMVDRALEKKTQSKSKRQRDCDFSSDVLSCYRKKWGIEEK